jgi:hypothetical protein
VPLIHHELCFGCGRANLFGLLVEAERGEDGTVRGRWFVKQDHQGPHAGAVHPGLLAAALMEIASFAAGPGQTLRRVEVAFAPERLDAVGSFCELTAHVRAGDGDRVAIDAAAVLAGEPVARLTADLFPD